MADPHLDPKILAQVVRAHPHWTLAQLRDLLGPKVLERVRVADLWTAEDMGRGQAESQSGPMFDACVLRVLREARQAVRASYLRERVGGPRWKLQASLGRLVDEGVVARDGTTSNRRYWSVGSD